MHPSIFGFLAAFFTTAAYVPQVWHTWKTKSTKDLSLPMLLMFCAGVFFWLVYGIFLIDLPMISANSITLLLALSLLVMKLRHKDETSNPDAGLPNLKTPE